MGCRGGSKTRIRPQNQQNQFVRVNGLTRPIHYLQVVAWIILLIFILVYFGVVAPAISMPWKPAAFVCVGLLLLIHIVTHIVATVKNPADSGAKAQMKQNHQMPQFDRSKHQHVIENEYCHLCETYVSKSSKHCRACNKCVMDFDHHCLWLNNCVGGVNYRYFLSTIASAFLGTLVITAVTLFVFINSFLGYQFLDEGQCNSVLADLLLTVVNASKFLVWWKATAPEVFQVFMGILVVLCLICSILLGQLFFFHLYLIRRGLTTYEYIQNSRVKKEGKQNNAGSADDVNTDDMEACATPRSIVDTAVTTTTEGKTVVHVSKPSKDKSEKLDAENRASYKATTHSATPDAFLATEARVANGLAKNNSAACSRSEFTNAAFSSEEAKNFNSNSNGGIRTLSQLSAKGSISHASSLGELHPWESNVDPPIILAPGPPSPRNSIGTPNSSIKSDIAQSLENRNQLHPKSGAADNSVHRLRRPKRKQSSKKSLVPSEDGLPRPLPALPENSNPSLSQSVLRKKTVLPPLRNSVEWASSSEDLHSVISSQRKLPSITPSSSVNSFTSYASGSVISNRHVEYPNA